MSKVQKATPRFSLILGLLLLGLFPTDIMTTIAVGLHLSHHGDHLRAAIPYALLSLFLLGSPALAVFAFGERGERALPKVRNWMSKNSWVVSEVVLLLFLAIEIKAVLS
jgi:hypothetical protein